VGVTAVTVNEIVGPILVRIGLARSGNMGQDRARLIDFIHEENIITDFRAGSLADAVRQLTELLASSHGLQFDREAFVADVLRRERTRSTCIGRGLAVPHGELADSERLVGVMGISREGLAVETPDGLPVRCMVLMALPPAGHSRHLEVREALARSVGADWSLQLQLYNARTPAHVYEILHNEEFEDFNYFLDDAGELPPPGSAAAVND
jgi:PTS system fructose-specific IIC component